MTDIFTTLVDLCHFFALDKIFCLQKADTHPFGVSAGKEK